MEEAGVNMQFHRKLDGVKTAVGFITLTPSGENNIIIVGGANVHYDDLKQLPTEYTNAIDRSKIILLQREIPQEINILVAKYAHSKGWMERKHNFLILIRQDCCFGFRRS